MYRYVDFDKIRKVPVPYLKARLRLVKQLERVYWRAVCEREKYCNENSIDFRVPMWGIPSADPTFDKLYDLWLGAHVENKMLEIKICDVEQYLRKHHNA